METEREEPPSREVRPIREIAWTGHSEIVPKYAASGIRAMPIRRP
tara:strand:- start:541 stop:675 length:135 start_codon:yes stop_codon:yes gene_type:complete